MSTAIISAVAGVPVRRQVAMTGEVTLRGRVLPIGGLKEKVLAAHRAGLRTVVAPAENRSDIDDVPTKVRRQMRFVWVDDMDAVLTTALMTPATSRPAPQLARRPRRQSEWQPRSSVSTSARQTPSWPSWRAARQPS